MEIPSEQIKFFQKQVLQWGHGVLSVEIASEVIERRPCTVASMGPRSFIRGNGEIYRNQLLQVSCFNGATEFYPWKSGTVGGNTVDKVASMGPRSFIRGNLMDIMVKLLYLMASMGPRSFIRGNIQQHRKAETMLMEASMGPRSFIRGNACSIVFQARTGGGLQWGHGVLSVEMMKNGRACPPFNKLQWGHGVLSVEMLKHPNHFYVDYIASMGPRSFIRGNLVNEKDVQVGIYVLQWGHGVLSVEIRGCRIDRDPSPRLQWGHGVLSVEIL